MGDNKAMTLRRRIAKRLAEVLTVFHIELTIFGIISIPLMFYFPQTKTWVLGFALLILINWIIFWDCPLTILEKKLRARFNPQTTYRTTFLRHYLKKMLGIPISEAGETIVAIAYLMTIFVVSLT